MIRSMTGFGSVAETVEGEHFGVEIRSLNGKHFKCHLRLPDELLGLEPELESTISGQLFRGTVTVTVRYEDRSEHAASTINKPALQRYMDDLSSVSSVAIDPASLLHLPGVLISDELDERRDRCLQTLQNLVARACEGVLSMRIEEGRAIETDLDRHIKAIESALSIIEERAPEVNTLYSDRLKHRMQSMLGEIGADVREEDVLREIAIFAEKSDISEEIDRLKGHLVRCRELIGSDGTDPVGRTLDFLSQEMLREANTMGSKCLDAQVGRHVVDIKVSVDRIKEQVQNVE
ncbi:MAG: YicC family protein [Phycisphaerales bacterium]|nr:YicC family protein [Phycisphaerales bacterium]